MPEVVQVKASVPRDLKRRAFAALALKDEKFNRWLERTLEQLLRKNRPKRQCQMRRRTRPVIHIVRRYAPDLGRQAQALLLLLGDTPTQNMRPQERRSLRPQQTADLTVSTGRRQPPRHPLATRGNVMIEYSTPHLTEIPHPSRALPRQPVTPSATYSRFAAWLRHRQCPAVG